MGEPSELPPGPHTRCMHCGEAHPGNFAHCPKTGRPLGGGEALVGRTIGDRYRIVGLVGEGGMGAVYVAEHTLLGRTVAVKRLHPELAQDAHALTRFQREARAAAATGHENVVEVLDLGFAEDGAPYLVMEYLSGRTLAATLRKEGRLAPTRACRIVGQVLAALTAVHARAIVHRDLKPENVFLVKRGGHGDWVKVLDFGVSKVKPEGEEPLDLTRTGVMLGTPYYMSPEQARGVKPLDHRVDLYATGVMLFEALAGRLPYEAANYHALLQAILSIEPPRLDALGIGVAPGLADVVHRALAKDPRARFASAGEMHRALVPFGAAPPASEDERPHDPPDASHAPTLHAVPPAPTPSGPAITDAVAAHLASIPRPRNLARTPVSFAAQSRDWIGSPRDAAVLTASVRETPAIAPSAEAPRPGSVRDAPAVVASHPRPASVRDAPAVTPSPDGRSALVREVPGVTPSPDARPPAVRAPAATPGPQPPGPQPPRPAAVREAPAPYAAAARDRRDPSTSFRTVGAPELALAPPVSISGATAEGSTVKAALFLAALGHITHTRGEDSRARLIEALPPAARAHATRGLSPTSFVPLADFESFLTTADRILGRGDGLLATEIGRAVAAHDLPTTHPSLWKTPSPALALARLPHVFRSYHGQGELRASEAPDGGHRLELAGLEPDGLLHALAMLGFVSEVLERAGAKDLRISLLSSRARGDARTLMSVRWA